MAKIISQETYDEAFKENLELMDNSVSEARIETISQFEAMGVNLGKLSWSCFGVLAINGINCEIF